MILLFKVCCLPSPYSYFVLIYLSPIQSIFEIAVFYNLSFPIYLFLRLSYIEFHSVYQSSNPVTSFFSFSFSAVPSYYFPFSTCIFSFFFFLPFFLSFLNITGFCFHIDLLFSQFILNHAFFFHINYLIYLSLSPFLSLSLFFFSSDCNYIFISFYFYSHHRDWNTLC